MRIFDKKDGHAIADYVMSYDEKLDENKPLLLFDPNAIWKKQTITNFTYRDLMVAVYEKGKLVYETPDLDDIQAYCKAEVDTLWDEVKRFEYPHRYYVDLSEKLWSIKQNLLMKMNTDSDIH